VTVVGCSMAIWARTLRIGRGMDGSRGPSGAHFVVCSLLVLGPKYQILPSRRFWAQKRLKKQRLDEKRLGNGWVIVSHQPLTVVNRWRRGVGARVVLGLAIRSWLDVAVLELLSRREEPSLRGVYINYAYCFLLF
jgi:hypothetical protein